MKISPTALLFIPVWDTQSFIYNVVITWAVAAELPGRVIFA
jgi:hypothetical protein